MKRRRKKFIWLSDEVTKYVPPNIRAKMEYGSDFDISNLVIADNFILRINRE